MNRSIRYLLVLLMIFALIPAIHAFESTLTLQGGVNIPFDDIDGEDEWMGAWGLSWEAWMTKSLALGFNPYFTNLKVWDGNDYYGSTIEGIDIYLKLRPDRYIALNYDYDSLIQRVAPFIALGGGYAAHGTKGIINGVPGVENEYMFVLPHAAAGISFLTKWNTTFDLGVKFDYTDSDLIDLVEEPDWNDGYIMPYIGLGLHFGARKLPPTPVVVVSGYIDRFSTEEGTPSRFQSYNISGTDLTGNINIAVPEGFELSVDGGSSWHKSASLDPSADRPVMIRMTGMKSGDFEGTILNSSAGAVNVNIPVSGSVEAPIPPPEINISGNLGGFDTGMGTPSAAQSYNISGSDLTGRILVKAPRGFEISTDGGKSWIATASLDPDFDGPVWVRLIGTRRGIFDGLITHTSEGTGDINIPVSGTVGEPTNIPRISISGNLGGFKTEMGTPSEAQSYNISGSNLTGWTLVTAPNGYEISVDDGNTWVTSANLEPDFSGPIWVRMTGYRVGAFQGFIVHTSEGAERVNIPVSGDVAEPEEVTELKEDMYTYVVHFPTNEYIIPEADKPFLDRVVESMKKFPGIRIQIQGHTDITGGDEINIPLSLNRAKFVRQYLVDKGIDESRIDVKGFSSDRPIATNKTAEGRAANRRADMIVLD
ncbi:MAG: OmpA family protein [Candidatus Syntrophosphaera sp.]